MTDTAADKPAITDLLAVELSGTVSAAVLDRALNDAASLTRRLDALTAGHRLDAKGWAASAMREAGLWLCPSPLKPTA